MNLSQNKEQVRALAEKLYMTRTGDDTAPKNKVSALDYMLAVVALDHADGQVQWEYGTTFSKDGKDSASFPTWWTTSLKEAKEDLDWHAKKDSTAFPDRKWRIVKRHPAGVEELHDSETRELEEMEDNG